MFGDFYTFVQGVVSDVFEFKDQFFFGGNGKEVLAVFVGSGSVDAVKVYGNPFNWNSFAVFDRSFYKSCLRQQQLGCKQQEEQKRLFKNEFGCQTVYLMRNSDVNVRVFPTLSTANRVKVCLPFFNFLSRKL